MWPVRYPGKLYTAHMFPTSVRPVLGKSLITSHVMPIGVNESVIKRRHNLLQAIQLEQYSSKNAVALFKGNKKFNISQGPELSGSFLTQDRNWYILLLLVLHNYKVHMQVTSGYYP